MPPELPLSSYSAPPKMNEYLPKSSAAYTYSPTPAAVGPTPYHPPGTLPMSGTPYQGAPAKPRAPLSPQIVDNHSPQPYHQAQPSWVKGSSQPQQQQQQSVYQDSQQNYQQSSTTTTTTSQKSLYEQAKTSSGINTVREMRSRFSGDNVAGQNQQQQQYSQTLPRNFLSAPSQQSPAFSASPVSPTLEGTKVRNASPLPFGRHATTTNKANYENSYTKTQFHNKLYQPPKGPLQHSFINNHVRNQSLQSRGPQYDSYNSQQQQARQQQYQAPSSTQNTLQQQNNSMYNEHVSRSHFRSPAQQPRQNTTAPVFRNVTNLWCICR